MGEPRLVFLGGAWRGSRATISTKPNESHAGRMSLQVSPQSVESKRGEEFWGKAVFGSINH